MQNEEKPIVVNMAEKQDTLTILHGEAPKKLNELAPVKIEIAGTIDAPLRWLEKRIGDIDQHKAYLHVNRDKLHMVLIIAEDDPYRRGTVSGKLQLSDIFQALGINSGKEWVPETLGQFLKLHRTYFPNRDENNAVVFALKQFEAKVNQTVQRETKENGNRAMVFRQAVDSNIPEAFKLRLPIFSGGDPMEIDVETYASIDGSDVTVSLQSAGAYDAIEDVKLNAIGRVIEQIREVAPELVIIEQ